MVNRILLLLFCLVLFGANVTQVSAQQYVLGVDSTNRAAHLFDPTTGALVQQNFLSWAGVTSGFSSTAKHAMQVGDQLWVSDQIFDSIFRYDLTGNYLGLIGNAGLDNIKGMEVVGNQVWVTNAGTNNGASGDSIVFIDIASTSITGSIATNGSLFDLVNYQGQVLASNIGNDSLEWYDLNGNLTGTFHVSNGVNSIDFPQQLFASNNGNLLAAGFSAPSGIYQFDSLGNSLGIVAAQDLGPRGVLELGNGQIIWTNGSGFFVGSTNVFATSGQFLAFVDLTAIPEPQLAGIAILLGSTLWSSRRRQR